MSATTIAAHRAGSQDLLEVIREFVAEKIKWAQALASKAATLLTAAWHKFTNLLGQYKVEVTALGASLLATEEGYKAVTGGIKWAITKAQQGWDWLANKVGFGFGWVLGGVSNLIGKVSPTWQAKFDAGVMKVLGYIVRFENWSKKVRARVTGALFTAMDSSFVSRATRISAGMVAVSALATVALSVTGLIIPAALAKIVTAMATLGSFKMAVALIPGTFATATALEITANEIEARRLGKLEDELKKADSMVREARNMGSKASQVA